jgi:hypothetical protein
LAVGVFAAFGAGVAAHPGVARADVGLAMDQLWPAMPHHEQTSMSDQLADWMTSVGVKIDHHLGALSHDVLDLRIDGRGQRTHVGLHAGTRYLSFALTEDVHVADGIARMRTRLQLEVGAHALDVQLPDVEMQQDEYRGERIVELNVPLLERHW